LIALSWSISMSQTIFLTGASGFVGGAIARTLANLSQDKAVVRAMSRSSQSDEAIAALGATSVRCELGAINKEQLSGCDVVIHCAAFVKQWGTREQFWQANVEGTQQLLNAAREAGVRRFIHIGTEAALFYGQHMRDIDETYPYPKSSPYLYSATKAVAEQRVLAANTSGFTTMSIRPRFVWGPGDQTVLPALVKMIAAKQFTWIDRGRATSSTTHIANLVHAVTLALTLGHGGNTYFVTDPGTITLREFLTALLATRGVTPPDKSVSAGSAQFFAATVEAIWRLFGIKSDPPLTRFTAAMMSHDCTIKCDKAARELHYTPTITREQGLAELKSAYQISNP
jgi:nucleoside-diphosphate-sugar epimerase